MFKFVWSIMKTASINLLMFLIVSAQIDCFSAERSPQQLSALVIGAGPAGLSTAIVAHQQGVDVTIVEKRASYSRKQMVFLLESSLELLEKWQVAIPEMNIVDFNIGEKMGFVKISDLERGLNERVKELGIKRFHGEFIAFSDVGLRVAAAVEKLTLDLPYDIVVAADGVHSHVREELGIECKKMGVASGTWACSLFPDFSGDLDISEFIYRPSYVLRRISMPHASLILTQSFVNHATPIVLNVDALIADALDCGWLREVEVIASGRATIVENIEIVFQQAQHYSHKAKRAILVGDAAATASFFHGMGVNTALKTAMHAGEFFKDLQCDIEGTYNTFNDRMQTTTDALIHYCEFLLPMQTSAPLQ